MVAASASFLTIIFYHSFCRFSIISVKPMFGLRFFGSWKGVKLELIQGFNSFCARSLSFILPRINSVGFFLDKWFYIDCFYFSISGQFSCPNFNNLFVILKFIQTFYRKKDLVFPEFSNYFPKLLFKLLQTVQPSCRALTNCKHLIFIFISMYIN